MSEEEKTEAYEDALALADAIIARLPSNCEHWSLLQRYGAARSAITALKEEGQATLRSAPIATDPRTLGYFREALADLVDKVMAAEPYITSACAVAANHGSTYKGPGWKREMAFARDVLAGREPPSPPIPETENGQATRSQALATAPITDETKRTDT